jgi:hypothetical protein
MRTMSRIEWEVLDATADDVENLEQIYKWVAMEFVADERAGGESASSLTPGCWRPHSGQRPGVARRS